MAAGERFIFFVANEQDGKSAGGDGFYRRDLGHRKTRKFFVAIKQRPGAGSEKSLAEPGIFSQTGVVVSRFAEIGERRFGDDGFDAAISGRRLPHHAGAHGFSGSEKT